MKLRYSHILAAGLSLLLTSTTLHAQQTTQLDVPKTVSYQGLLTSGDGTPLPDGLHTITVTLYGDQAGTQVIWQDSYEAQTTGGLFNLYLGSGAQALPQGKQLNRPLWVGTSVDGGMEMGPLTPLSASPYALNVSDGAITGTKLAAGAVTADKVDMEYVSGIQIDDRLISESGSVLRLQSSEDFRFGYDAQTGIVTVHRNEHITTDTKDEEKETRTLDVGVGTNNWLGRDMGTNNPFFNAPTGIGNTLGGGILNSMGHSGLGSTIAGGYYNAIGDTAHWSTISGGDTNVIGDHADWSTISGGKRNTIDDLADRATISGGNYNTIGYNSYASTIAGGEYNNIDDDIDRSTISGGNSNQILGTGSSFGTIAGGEINTIGAAGTPVDWGTISGGDSNLVTGNHGTIGGGRGNKAANTATVGGGLDNYATAVGATIAGGAGQNATANYSTISGGHGHTAAAGNSSIGGGWNNSVAATGDYSTIGGGSDHTIDGQYGTVGGGFFNRILDAASSHGTIAGGTTNKIGDVGTPAQWGSIGGGQNNHVTFNHGTIGGGKDNEAYNTATVGGGLDNHATGIGATIAGGAGQNATANYSTVSGGHGHTAAASNSSIGGGWNNSVAASGNYSFIGGGSDHTAEGQYGTIAGGFFNRILDAASGYGAIAGGEGNKIGDPGAAAQWGSIGGGQNNHVTFNHGTIGGGKDNEAANTATVGGGFDNHATGTGATIGGGSGHVVGSNYSTIAGGNQNNISSLVGTSAIGGGYDNRITNTGGAPLVGYNTIAGGTGNVIDTDPASRGVATIGGGAANLIKSGGHRATIPGGDLLIAQSWAQTVIGGLNEPKGSVPFRYQGTTDKNEPIFIIGNGASSIARSNAFEVSYNGHSIVYDENGSGGWTAGPGRGAVDGGTYTDNVIYGWAEVSANAEPGESCGDFGIKDIQHPVPGLYIVELNIVEPDGSTDAFINCGAVTATIGSGMGPMGQIPPSTTCAHISTSNIANNVFEVYITLPQPDPMAPCTEGVDLPFKFHVTGRVD